MDVIPVNKVIAGWFEGGKGSKEADWSIANLQKQRAADIRMEVLDYVERGVNPRSTEARQIVNNLRSQFPVSKGWQLDYSVPVFDKKYEGHISVVASNQYTNQSSLINFGVGQSTIDKRRNEARAGILQHLYQGMNPTTDVNSYIYDIQPGGAFALKSVTPDTKLLNRMFYSGLKSLYSSIHPSKLGTKVLSADAVAAAQATAAHAPSGMRQWKGGWGVGRTYTVLDIETGAGRDRDYKSREVLSIGAIKMGIDPSTGEWVEIDRFNRVYKPRNVADQQYVLSTEVHGLTPEVIKALRRGKGWAKTYNQKEFEALNKFIGEGVIIGHNAAVFDIPTLQRFGQFEATGQIDTLVAAKNLGERYFSGYKLHEVYQSLFGRTMEQDGLTHHDAMSDVIATGKIFTELVKHKGGTIDKIKWIMRHPGHSLVERDKYINSEIVTGMGLGSLTDTGFKTYDIEDYIDMATDNITPEQAALYKAGFDENDSAGMHVQTGGDPDLPRAGDVAISRDAGVEAFTAFEERIANTIAASNQAAQNLEAAIRASAVGQRMSALSRIGKGIARGEMTLAEGLGLYDIDTDRDTTAEAKIDTFRKIEQKRIRQAALDKQARESQRQALAQQRAQARADARIIAQRGAFTDRVATAQIRERITSGQAQDLISKGILQDSFSDLNHELERTVQLNKRRIDGLQTLSKIEDYNFLRWRDATNQQIQSVSEATGGFVPRIFHRATGYYTNALVNAQNIRYQKYETGRNLWQAIGISAPMIGTKIGTLVGGPIGGAIGGAIGGTINLGTQLVGLSHEYAIKMKGQQLSQAFNIMSGTVQLLLAPLRLFGNLLRTGGGALRGFIGIIKSGFNDINNLGNPLTGATGIAYPEFQGYQMLDTMFGLQNGTVNSMAESFAQAQTNLYSRGQMDTNRVVASAMLGVFGDVYATDSGGFERTVNTLAQRFQGASPEEQKQILGLASSIHSSLPQMLQVMGDMGITSLSQFMNPGAARGMYWNPIGESERKRFRIDNYEYQSSMQSFSNARMRFSARMWESYGKEIMNGLNEALDKAAQGDYMALVDWAVNLLTRIVQFLQEAISKVDWSGLKAKLSELFGTIFGGINTSGIKNAIKNIVGAIYDAFSGLTEYLEELKITPTLEDGRLGLKIETAQDRFNEAREKSPYRLFARNISGEFAGTGLEQAIPVHKWSKAEEYWANPNYELFYTAGDEGEAVVRSKTDLYEGSALAQFADKGTRNSLKYASPYISQGFKDFFGGLDRAYSDEGKMRVMDALDNMFRSGNEATRVLSADAMAVYRQITGKTPEAIITIKDKSQGKNEKVGTIALIEGNLVVADQARGEIGPGRLEFELSSEAY